MIFTWNADPILLTIPLLNISIHWYGLFFASGFLIGYFFVNYIFNRNNIDTSHLDKLLFFLFIGTIVGARLGHCFFYDPEYYLKNPINILKIWEGGLASHGGGIGLVISLIFFTKFYKYNFFWLTDILCIPMSLEGALIRIGNFFNSEIYGDFTRSNYGVIFSRLNDLLPRHPVQLYESLAYFSIFTILLILYKLKIFRDKKGIISGSFLVLIFTSRFFIEYFKPEQASFNTNIHLFNIQITVGQILSIPFIMSGFVIILISCFRKEPKTKS